MNTAQTLCDESARVVMGWHIQKVGIKHKLVYFNDGNHQQCPVDTWRPISNLNQMSSVLAKAERVAGPRRVIEHIRRMFVAHDLQCSSRDFLFAFRDNPKLIIEGCINAIEQTIEDRRKFNGGIRTE